MANENIDNKSFNFLKSLYECEECSIRDIARYLGLKDISATSELFTIALPLFEAEYLVIKHPQLTYSDSLSFESYKSACESNSLPLLSPDCTIGILPKGRAFVEERLQRQEEFEKQFKALQSIADSSMEYSKIAKEQAESAKAIADSSMETSNSAELIAKSAEKSSESSTKYAKISAALSIIAIIISIVAIVLPLLCE